MVTHRRGQFRKRHWHYTAIVRHVNCRLVCLCCAVFSVESRGRRKEFQSSFEVDTSRNVVDSTTRYGANTYPPERVKYARKKATRLLFTDPMGSTVVHVLGVALIYRTETERAVCIKPRRAWKQAANRLQTRREYWGGGGTEFNNATVRLALSLLGSPEGPRGGRFASGGPKPGDRRSRRASLAQFCIGGWQRWARWETGAFLPVGGSQVLA